MRLAALKLLTLADFQQFSKSSEIHEKAVIGRPLLGSSHFKVISSISLQRYSGETSSIVTTFKKALVEK